jgi:hypothetical protein
MRAYKYTSKLVFTSKLVSEQARIRVDEEASICQGEIYD